MNELVSGWDDSDGHHAGLDSVVRLPGLGNLWPMPIDNRLKMLSTGVKSPVGIKIQGPDLKTLAVDETCENCGGAMTVRRGKRGFFLGCSNYPKCKGTKEPSEATLEKITAFTGG
jgi:hypothetical protein